MLTDNDSNCLASQIIYELRQTQTAKRRPCMMLRPELVKDGDAWGAYYPDHASACDPDHLQGWGDTPAAAFDDFDAHYYGKQHDDPAPARGGRHERD